MTTKQDFNWLPVALFGSIMGMTGLSSAFKQAHHLWGMPLIISKIIGVITIISFIILIISYALKIIRANQAFKDEFNHPVTGALFGTPLISCLLVPVIIADYNLWFAQALWWFGVFSMSIFAWHICTRWLKGGMVRTHATPAWFIPLVGMIDIPIAVPALHFSHHHDDIMMWGLAVGLFFAIPLFTIVFSRLFFEEPIPMAARPAMMILLAPFAIGFLAYVNTIGHIDLVAKALFSLTIFLFFVLLRPLKRITHCSQFRLSWWSVSFPMASAANAAIQFAYFRHSLIFDIIGAIMFTISAVIIFFLMGATLWGILRGKMEELSH